MDLLLRNVRMVNVFSRNVSPVHIAVCDGAVAGFGDYEARETVDLKDRYVAPGFIDAHVHIESAMVGVSEFVRAVVPSGTTTVVADPHEIANVLGVPAIEYMIRSAADQPMNVRYALPSCVPATQMENAGAVLSAADLEPFLSHDSIVALAEVMNYPGVIFEEPDLLRKIQNTKHARKSIDGHAPGLIGKQLYAYLSAGIASDHECTTADEALKKLKAGMHIMIREGTCARNLDALFPIITEKTAHRVMWCTDDRHPHDLIDEGHVDAIVRRAVTMGLDPVLAIQIATLNPARYFRMDDVGALAPGYRADMIVFSDLHDLRVERVYTNGRLVAEGGAMLPRVKKPAPVAIPKSMNVKSMSPDFSIPARGRRIRVIDLVPDQVVTGQMITEAKLSDGRAVSDIRRDILKLAVVERHKATGNVGLGFVRGFGLRGGALASSVAHDSHNIIIMGANDDDMGVACRAVVEMGGGFAVASGGQVTATLPLPIAGLMSEEPVTIVRKQMDRIIHAAKALGTPLSDPFMALGFIALPVIPELKITDLGLVDVALFKPVALFTD